MTQDPDIPQFDDDDDELKQAFEGLNHALQHKAQKELTKKVAAMTTDQLEENILTASRNNFGIACTEVLKALTVAKQVRPEFDLRAAIAAHSKFQAEVLCQLIATAPPMETAISQIEEHELHMSQEFIDGHRKHIGEGCPMGEYLYRKSGEFPSDEDGGVILEYSDDKEAS